MKPNTDILPRYLSITEAARYLSVHPDSGGILSMTKRNWTIESQDDRCGTTDAERKERDRITTEATDETK